MKFAYADPPYPGMAHLYKDHPDYGGEVDHKALIERLVAEYPDGWALSTAAVNLWHVLPFCPSDVTVLAWCLSNPVYRPPNKLVIGWQPLILRSSRRPSDVTLGYLVSGNGTDFLGGKTSTYCVWLFRCLGALPGDTLDDLFPGSGAVSRAWEKYQRQLSFIHTEEDYSGKKVKLPI